MTDLLYSGQDLVDMLREQIDATKDDPPDLAGIAALEQAVEEIAARASAAAQTGGGSSLSGCRLPPGQYGQGLANFVAKPWVCEPYVGSVQQHDAHVKARAARPAQPPPAATHCACGQELRTAQRAEMADSRVCGDCFMQGGSSAFRHTPPHRALPDRIAAAQPKAADADPTQTWGAGATPSYDWEGR